MGTTVLALYDFASKQEFIYRTSKIKEISGASDLLSKIYEKLIDVVNDTDKLDNQKYSVIYDVKTDFSLSGFEESNADGIVLYDGGGNLMVLYRDKETYKAVNRIASVYLLENVPTLHMIASCVECGGNFESDVKRLYRQNRINKNFYPASDIVAVTPMTQIDPMTFLPVVRKDKKLKQSISADRDAKIKAYDPQKNREINDLENLEGLTAVIYIDGNSMGQKLQKCSDPDYNKGVFKLREFSENTNNDFVVKPLEKIEEFIKNSKYKGYRQVIGGGDEITIICDARIALEVVRIYFETLKSGDDNYACAGISVFHAKAPFTIAYEIAEAACESAKQRAHKENDNYLDFYYCHAGITNDFETLRGREQSITKRPYRFDEAMKLFDEYKPLLQAAGRSNVKALGNAAQEGIAKYRFEVERVNAYLGEKGKLKTNEDGIKKEIGLIYDMAEFYDLWFAKEDE